MKKILAALALLALVFGTVAAGESTLTFDLQTKAVSIESNSHTDTTTISSLDNASNYKDSTIDWNFTSDEGNYGARIAFNFQDVDGAYPSFEKGSTASWDYFTAWLLLGEWGKVQGGIFTSRGANRVNSLIDEHHLGVMVWQVAGETDPDVISKFQADRLAGGGVGSVVFDVYNLGPLTLQAGVAGTKSVIYRGDEDRTGQNGQVLGEAGARVLGKFLDDGLAVSATYRIKVEANDILPDLREALPGIVIPSNVNSISISRDNNQYRNNFGLYANVNMIENLKLLVGYGFSGVLFTPEEKALIYGLGTMMNAGIPDLPVKISDKSSEFFNGIDLRAQYELSDTIALATHNNISFGKKSVLATPDFTGAKELELGKSYFLLYDEIEAQVGLTDTLSVQAYARNYLDIVTDIKKYDGSNFKNGANKEEADHVVTKDKLVLGARLIYALNENASVNVGFAATTYFEQTSTGEQYASPYGYGDTSANPDSSKAKVYVKDPIAEFAIPIGITVKF
jgi:hypothetical protein